MRIALIGRADEQAGGSARAASDLARSLEAAGHEVDHWIAFLTGNPRAGKSYRVLTAPRLRRLAYRGLLELSRKSGLHDLLAPAYPLLRRSGFDRYDVVHIHDIQETLSPQAVRLIARQVPTVWTLHACEAFTGGCIYPGECTRYRTRCGQCPQLASWPISSPRIDLTGWFHDQCRTIHSRGLVVCVAPCEWMRAMARSSGMFRHDPVLIRHGVDTECFRPMNRSVVRDVLGLPRDRKIVLLGATVLHDERKGARFAIEALRRLPDNKPYVLAVGHPPRPQDAEAFRGVEVQFAGFVGDTRLLAQYYAAADVHLFPTLADNSPVQILETMASGTPTVSFETGGVPESIVHCETGYVARQRDVDDLVAGLKLALDGVIAQRWGSRARERALERFSLERYRAEHVALYDDIMRGRFAGVAPRSTTSDRGQARS
jgi:glycosyltransferase involved in cell wall biosynthesis